MPKALKLHTEQVAAVLALPGLARDGVLPGVFYTPADKGVTVSS